MVLQLSSVHLQGVRRWGTLLFEPPNLFLAENYLHQCVSDLLVWETEPPAPPSIA